MSEEREMTVIEAQEWEDSKVVLAKATRCANDVAKVLVNHDVEYIDGILSLAVTLIGMANAHGVEHSKVLAAFNDCYTTAMPLIKGTPIHQSN